MPGGQGGGIMKEEGGANSPWVILLLAVPPLLLLVWRSILVKYWLRPQALSTVIRKQGIRGPPPKFMIGNMVEILKMRHSSRNHDMEEVNHDIVEHVLADVYRWSKQYGKRYIYWWGTEPRIVLWEPELVREVMAKKIAQFEKSEIMVRGVVSLVGRGLVAVKGDEWSHHRRVVAPAFYLDKLKKMVPRFSLCTVEMLDKWDAMIKEDIPEIEVCGEFEKLTADIISHTAFGSSYLKGQRVFELLRAIPMELSKTEYLNWLPGKRFLPFPANFRARKLYRELRTVLLGLIHERRAAVQKGISVSYGNDLLGLMLAECDNSSMNDEMVVEECKTFYFAGHETTASLLTWSMMLLANHPEWQERARLEVQQVCGGGLVDADSISKLKLINMILHESLRLYPPALLLTRGCFEDTMLGDLFVPKGAAVMFSIVSIHRDKELWGEDANEFNPERFKDGITSASKHSNAFLAFSLGPRVCVGQSFALIEAKVALATILQRFSFKLSPSYRHNPAPKTTLKPHHGLPLVLEKL